MAVGASLASEGLIIIPRLSVSSPLMNEDTGCGLSPVDMQLGCP
jgi:hypothetical protein